MALLAHAQFGNEWINHSQPYYKIPIGKDGIYRLYYEDLVKVGIPAGSIDAQTFQLFHRGVEQALYIYSEQDEVLSGNGYIEFYGRKNDGTLDAALYTPSSLQPHAYYNLYSDTTAYFLTYGHGFGKRMGYAPVPAETAAQKTYHLEENVLVLTTEYAYGSDNNGTQVYSSGFGLGEGWTGNQIHTAQQLNYTISGITNASINNGSPTLELLIQGRSSVPHKVPVYVGNPLRLLTTVDVDPFESKKVSLAISWSDISQAGTLSLQLHSLETTSVWSYISVSYIKLKYPQEINLNYASEKNFLLDNTNSTKVNIASCFESTLFYNITEPSHVIRIPATFSNNTASFLCEGNAITQKIFASNNFLKPTIKPGAFRSLESTDNLYVIISHPALRASYGTYADPVEAYAAYRHSDVGGGFDTLVVNTEELYDQFTSGEITPLAIRRFMRYLAHSHKPKYLFIIGKGLLVNNRYHRQPQNFLVNKDFVPTAGAPASDAYFTVGLSESISPHAHSVATGRIPATHPKDVIAYLEKVIEVETQPITSPWRKRVLHLSGGIEEGEPERFKFYLEMLAKYAEDHYYGAKVTPLAKGKLGVELINIADQVNEGVGLITFFGHSSPNALDFEVGKVSNPILKYNNPGKYPIFLINGCDVGNFFLNTTLFGEDWIITEKKGAVGFIAHSAYGFESTIRQYADYFYRVAFQDSTMLWKGVGDIQREVAASFLESNIETLTNIAQVQQMVLSGDPAISLLGARRPDAEINDTQVYITSVNDEPITVKSDSIVLNMIIRNFGQTRDEPLEVLVKRSANGQHIQYDTIVTLPKFSDTLTMVLRHDRMDVGGENTFEIILDPDNILQEENEFNNRAVVRYTIQQQGTKHLYPTPFAIVNEQAVNLSYQLTEVAASKQVLIELDTTHQFNSAFKKSITLPTQGYAQWPVSLLLSDSVTYYWRSRLVETQGEEQWSLTSFTFIQDGTSGWGQFEMPQLAENIVTGLVVERDQFWQTFKSTTIPIEVLTYGKNYPGNNTTMNLRIDGVEYNAALFEGNACRVNSVNLVAFDRKSTIPYSAVPLKWYNAAGRGCGRVPWVINNYIPSQMVTGEFDLLSYVDNVVEGDSVLIFTIGNADVPAWPIEAKQKLGELGISLSQLESIADGRPAVFMGRKGILPGEAKMVTGALNDVLATELSVSGGYNDGTMRTMQIGPASEWHSLSFSVETSANDEYRVDVIGVSLQGDEHVLYTNVSQTMSLHTVDAEQYPYLKLRWYAKDEVELFPAQLTHWVVLYESVPEGILIPQQDYRMTLHEGERFEDTYSFINITDKYFPDSLLVSYDFFNKTTRTSLIQSKNILAPLPHASTVFSFNTNTMSSSGDNDVIVKVNPNIVPEQYFDNNQFARLNYVYVVPDKIRPVLDVMVDDRYLKNGDFVSHSPVIRIAIWDENTILFKENPDGVTIHLTKQPCNNCELQEVDLTSGDVSWKPSTLTEPFTLYYTPVNLSEGVYSLRVTASDASLNGSAVEPYEILFEVSNETKIAIQEPYPNPASINSRFVMVANYTHPSLEGKLRLIDVNGREVWSKAFSSKEIYVGENVIDLDWTTEILIPNGVYLYHFDVEVDRHHYQKRGRIVVTR
jgi:hypothetical protein